MSFSGICELCVPAEWCETSFHLFVSCTFILKQSLFFSSRTDDDDDYEFGPRETSYISDQASDKNSFQLHGATECETSTEPETPVQQFVDEVPHQFADSTANSQPQQHLDLRQQLQQQVQQQRQHLQQQLQQQQQQLQQQQSQQQAQQTEQQQQQQQQQVDTGQQQYIEIQNEHYPCIGSAVSLYPFTDNDDPTMLNIQAQEQFYVLHRDEDWTYVTRVDGSAKGMVPTSYLRILMY